MYTKPWVSNQGEFLQAETSLSGELGPRTGTSNSWTIDFLADLAEAILIIV